MTGAMQRGWGPNLTHDTSSAGSGRAKLILAIVAMVSMALLCFYVSACASALPDGSEIYTGTESSSEPYDGVVLFIDEFKEHQVVVYAGSPYYVMWGDSRDFDVTCTVNDQVIENNVVYGIASSGDVICLEIYLGYEPIILVSITTVEPDVGYVNPVLGDNPYLGGADESTADSPYSGVFCTASECIDPFYDGYPYVQGLFIENQSMVLILPSDEYIPFSESGFENHEVALINEIGVAELIGCMFFEEVTTSGERYFDITDYEGNLCSENLMIQVVDDAAVLEFLSDPVTDGTVTYVGTVYHTVTINHPTEGIFTIQVAHGECVPSEYMPSDIDDRMVKWYLAGSMTVFNADTPITGDVEIRGRITDSGGSSA